MIETIRIRKRPMIQNRNNKPDRADRRSRSVLLRVEELEQRWLPSITPGNPQLTAAPNTSTTFTQAQVLAGSSDANVALAAINPTQPNNATLTANADGTFTFTPNNGFQGNTTFNFTVRPLSLQTKVTASDGAANAHFGAVAIDGDTAVIGAYGASAAQGAVYVFARSGAGWVQQFEIFGPASSKTGTFGSAVAISGDTLVIGDSQFGGGGAAFVYVRSGTTWSQQATLTASDEGKTDAFGWSVSISSDSVLVGSIGHTNTGPFGKGAAYVFTRSGTTWSQQAELNANNVADFDNFGNSVSISGDTALVGAPNHATNGNSSEGAAYLFTRSGTTWSQQQEIFGNDSGGGDNFGWSVALDTTTGTALVGAYNHPVMSGSTLNFSQGAAYVFVQSGGLWSQQTELTSADGTAGDQFGFSVALSGNTAFVGANLHAVKGNTSQGAAYQFLRSGTTWTQGEEWTASDGAASDQFGSAVALSGDTSLVGLPSKAVDGNASQGAAYFQEMAAPVTATANVTVAVPGANFDELAAYRPGDGSWSLDSNGQFGFQSGPVAGPAPLADRVMTSFSPAGASVLPVSGDWTGSGRSKIGDFENGTWHLDLNDNGVVNSGETFTFGQAGDVPVPGDYLTAGQINLAVFRSFPAQGFGMFIISDSNWLQEAQAGKPIGTATSFIYGAAGDRVVVGDWNGAGLTEVGVLRDAASFNPADVGDAVFSLDVANHHTFDASNSVFVFGVITDQVVIGDWDGSGTSKVGVYRPATAFNAPGTAVFSLDQHGQLDFSKDGNVFLFGLPTDKYVTGRWAYTTSTAPAQLPTSGAGSAAPASAFFPAFGLGDPTALDAFFARS